jgi:hypothetical protein
VPTPAGAQEDWVEACPVLAPRVATVDWVGAKAVPPRRSAPSTALMPERFRRQPLVCWTVLMPPWVDPTNGAGAAAHRYAYRANSRFLSANMPLTKAYNPAVHIWVRPSRASRLS